MRDAIQSKISVGSIVYDRHYDMVARIREINGPLILLARPSGLNWSRHRRSIRLATEWEQKQLRALAKLHAQRQRGLKSPT